MFVRDNKLHIVNFGHKLHGLAFGSMTFQISPEWYNIINNVYIQIILKKIMH